MESQDSNPDVTHATDPVPERGDGLSDEAPDPTLHSQVMTPQANSQEGDAKGNITSEACNLKDRPLSEILADCSKFPSGGLAGRPNNHAFQEYMSDQYGNRSLSKVITKLKENIGATYKSTARSSEERENYPTRSEWLGRRTRLACDLRDHWGFKSSNDNFLFEVCRDLEAIEEKAPLCPSQESDIADPPYVPRTRKDLWVDTLLTKSKEDIVVVIEAMRSKVRQD